MDTVLLLGCIQAFFLTVLLVSKRSRSAPDAILALWLGHIGVHLLIIYLVRRAVPVPALVQNLNGVLPLLQGPYLYLYVTALVCSGARLRGRWLIHLVPALLYVGLVVVILPGLDPADGSLTGISMVVSGAIGLSVPVYVALSLNLIRKHNVQLRTFLSSTDGLDLSWLRAILVGMCVLWVVVIGVTVSHFLQPAEVRHASSHAIFLTLTVFIYAIGYLGIRQKQVFADLVPDPSAAAGGVEERKYERSGLREERARQISLELTELMRTEKPFLRQDLSLQWLADSMDVPANHLSQVINQEFGANFHDFVNRFRVQEFLERRQDAASRNLTLLSIALASGFQSKASFNRVFKRLMGCTPSKYAEP